MSDPFVRKPGTLVTGSVQLARHLRRADDLAQAGAGNRVWESADIVSRDAWLTRMWREYSSRQPAESPLLLNSAQADILWRKAVRAASPDASVLLDLEATVAAAGRAWDLLQTWEAPYHAAEFAETADPAAFAVWKLAVERELHENGWILRSALPYAIGKRVAAGALTIAGPIAHAGFFEMSPADRRLLETCGAEPQALAAGNEAAARVRVTCDSAADELTRAAGWARAKLERDPAARIGIAVRGLAECAGVAGRIFDDVLQPGVAFAHSTTRTAFQVASAPRPSEDSVTGSALLLLRLTCGLPLADAGALFRSAFVGVDRVAGAKLLADLRRHGVQEASLQVEAVRQALPGLAMGAKQLPSAQRPSQWSAAFSKLLAMAGWPGKREFSSVEYEALETWKDLLSELASLDLVFARIDMSQALERLRQIAGARRSGSHDESAPVQIIDIREAAGIRWDALWIAGLDAGQWPPPARPNPFLPVALQRSAGMPDSSPEWVLSNARRLTAKLLSAAPEIVCSYARASGEEPLRVSPLIAHLPEQPPPVVASVTVAEAIFAERAAMEDLPPDQALPLAEGASQGGGISLLKNQAACPFRAFAVHRLYVKEPQEADLGISFSERGTVAHGALEEFWGVVKSRSELIRRTPLEIATLLASCVGNALGTKLGPRQQSRSLDRSRELEQERWERMLATWIEREKERPDFEVVACEAKTEVEVGGLKLTIKADRIDRMLADGSLAVLDYKTSDKSKLESWQGERPDEPQLPLYAITRQGVGAAHFVKLALGTVEMLGYDGARFAQSKEEWKPVLENLAAAFLKGDAAVDPKKAPQTCEYCHLKLLCRIGELGLGNGAAGDDADAEDVNE